MGQDPFPQKLVADGIAFSCSNTQRPETSLRFIFQEINDTVYKDNREYDPDLKRWSNQGVLMINTAFTTTIGLIGKHYDVWRPFTTFLFDMLTYQDRDFIYVFMGKKSQEWIDVIPESNSILTCSHPASAAYSMQDKWDSGDIFNKINVLSKKQFNTEIIW